MKHLTCADLVPHCTAEFDGQSALSLFEQYAQHARYEHAEPVQVIDLMLCITAA